jgi:hypothetical protein
MTRRGRQVLTSILALGLAVVLAGDARADRTPSVRTGGQKSSGSRTDVTVPYLTHGTDAFHARDVGPKIYKSLNVDDPKGNGIKPVFNLIFYGSKQNFGDKSEGAGPRPANQLRPGR